MKIWIKILGGFGAGAAGVLLVPRLFDGPGVPPMTALLLTGLVVGMATASALYFAVSRDLGLGRTVAWFAVGYNMLLVVVKFVLAPHGLYDLNRTVVLDQFAPMDTGGGAILTTGGVLIVYVVGYGLLYLVFRRRIANRLRRKLTKEVKIAIVVAGFFALIGLASGGFILAFLLFDSLVYLTFVFTSVVSLLVAAALVGAVALAGMAFKEAGDRANLVGNAALLTNFFWVGLAFIAMYHALWVVFILTLTTIWPLKVVTPK